ncbi:MAG: methyltransferase domain-containing protein [Candidatus Marinimicrobia bacterium]|nr:methyltransferase domain-containing protein [Candidatus Neomarinimicrobiota bacterium]
MNDESQPLLLKPETLREEIQKEYSVVATNPEKEFHFHTGRRLAGVLEYDEEMINSLPEIGIESFAGTGNPFAMGRLNAGENVVDVGSGAGFDSLLAARMVGPEGRVIGVEMTEAMLEKARSAAEAAGITNVEFKQGLAERLPVEEGWADVVISNGVINLCMDKLRAFSQLFRALKPGGRLQIADIIVQKAVPDSAKQKIDLWTG